MISIEPLDALLRKCKSATNILLQTPFEFLPRLLQERLLGRMFHAVYCDLGLQAFEALVRFDVLEGFFDRGFGGVGREGFEDGVRGRLADGRDHRLQTFRAAREEGDGEVAVGGGGEDAGDSCALKRY